MFSIMLIFVLPLYILVDQIKFYYLQKGTLNQLIPLAFKRKYLMSQNKQLAQNDYKIL